MRMDAITKEWLQLHYYDLNKTAVDCAKLQNCSTDTIYHYAIKFGITKKQNGRYKDKSMFVHSQLGKPKSEILKRKIGEGQLSMRSIYMISKKGNLLKTFTSINSASVQMNVSRANIKKCLVGVRKSAGGYKWSFKLTYGEEIIKRLDGLDFSLPIDDMLKGVYTGLPKRMNRQDASKYYSRKLKSYWRNVA